VTRAVTLQSSRAHAFALAPSALPPQGYDAFAARWAECLFENTFGCESTDAARAKQYGEHEAWAAGLDGQDVDHMLWQVDEPLPPTSTKNKFRQSVGLGRRPGDGATELQMGALRNSYLVRGSTVDVFRNVDDGLDDSEQLSLRLRDASGAAFTPTKALLARGEANLLLLTPNAEVAGGRSHSVFQLDIETEKVVSRWQCAKDGVPIPMLDIVGDSKSAQLEAGSTFMGLDGNRLARWDLRDRAGAVQDLASPTLGYVGGHDFARGTGFSCMATTGSGDVVVGGVDGKIRLYSDSTLRQAKTSFPGIGAPITHVDVTYDGKFVLATTDSYLMVISTLFKDKNGALKTGFTGKMGANIAAPRLLKLLPHDVARTGGAPFAKARFTWLTEADGAERWVSVVCGAFSVVWNFRAFLSSCAPGSGSTVCLDYTLVTNKDARLVDAAQLHGNFTRGSAAQAHLVVASDQGDISAFMGVDE